MVYIFCALYVEAKVWIEYFDLKKDVNNKYFQSFKNDNICLTITSSDAIRIASAFTYSCLKYGINKDDIIINIGTCAKISNDFDNNDIGKIYICNKITEYVSMHTFYPDIVYQHDFLESEIISGVEVYSKNNKILNESLDSRIIEKNSIVEAIKDEFNDTILYDMEAASIYKSASNYYGPHQVIFIKVVSDNGNINNITKEYILELMNKVKEPIIQYIESICRLTKYKNERGFTNYELQKIDKFCEDIMASVTMKRCIMQYIKYMSISGIDYMAIIDKLYQDKRVPCKSRNQGKNIIDYFKNFIIK